MQPYEDVYQAYVETIRCFLLRLTGNEHLAEELTQETFYQALRHWSSFRGESSVVTWLCSIAKRQYLSCLRREAPLPLEEELLGGGDDVSEEIIRSDRRMAAHRLLHSLPEPMREVFTLRTFGDLSHRQIASLFGKSEAWARVTYYRARQQLQQMAKEEGMHEE